MSEKFVLKINVENDAFSDGNLKAETIRILKETIKQLEDMQGSGKLYDENGNSVGYWGFLTK